MGSTQAAGMVEAVDLEQMDLETALTWHLQTNHYPPVNAVFVPVALEAIEKAQQGEWSAWQTYPNGLRRQVSDTIEGLHLDTFLGGEDDDEG